MLRFATVADLSLMALRGAFDRLEKKTDSPPLGLVVSTQNTEIAVQVMVMDERFNGLRLTTVRNFPRETWILYNAEDFFISGEECYEKLIPKE